MIPKITIDMGNTVLCDVCNEDYTNSNEHGGFLWNAMSLWAVCPKCAPEISAKLKRGNESRDIKAHCPEYFSFRDWILTFRNQPTRTEIEYCQCECPNWDIPWGSNIEICKNCHKSIKKD